MKSMTLDKFITSHERPLMSINPNWNGSKYNVMIEWENGKVTTEPIYIMIVLLNVQYIREIRTFLKLMAESNSALLPTGSPRCFALISKPSLDAYMFSRFRGTMIMHSTLTKQKKDLKLARCYLFGKLIYKNRHLKILARVPNHK